MRYCIQVSEYLVDHRRVFDTGDDADITTAFAAGFDIDMENTFESLCPCHRCAALGGRLVWSFLARCGSADGTSLGRCHQRSRLATGRKYAMIAGEVDSGPGYQGDQLGNEVQWFEQDMGGAVGIARGVIGYLIAGHARDVSIRS